MSTTSEARVNWTDPTLSDLAPRGWGVLVALVGVAVTITAVDVLVMYPAIARAMGHSQGMTWLTGIGLGLLALFAAGWSGWTWKGATGAHPGSRSALVLPVGLAIAWLGLGVLLMWMRMEVSASATTVAYEGTVPQVPDGSFDTVAAGVFLAVYVLCGLLTFGDLFHWRNDAHSAGRKARTELDARQVELNELEAVFQHLLANDIRRSREIAQVVSDAMITTVSNAAFADELKQRARHEIAVGLNDPAATGITSARHPDNPLARSQSHSYG